MSEKKYITKLKSKEWPDGGISLSFQANDYFRNNLKDVPDKAFVDISRLREPDEYGNTHTMSWKPRQGASAPPQAPAQAPY